MNLVFRVFHSLTKIQGLVDPKSDFQTEEKQIKSINLFVHSILKNILDNRKILGKKSEDYIPFENIILAFDSYSWRKDFLRNEESILMSDADYKAGRNKENDHIIKMIVERFQEVSTNIGLHVVKKDKFEADDIIGLFPFIDSGLNPDNKYVIISNDDDFTQLTANPNVFIFNPITKKWNKKFGKMALAVKTLKGDISDAIPNPYFSLKLDDYVVETQYGEITILQRLNGEFSSFCPIDGQMTIKYYNELLEIFKGSDATKEVVFSCNKTKIGFDKNYHLDPNMKLKFDKSVSKEEQERISEEVKYILQQIQGMNTDGFVLDNDYKNHFIYNTLYGLISKYQKEHLKYIKANFTGMSKQEHTTRNLNHWATDLAFWNQDLFSKDDLETLKGIESKLIESTDKKSISELTDLAVESLITMLSKKFEHNLERNNTLIDFTKIPNELQDIFKNELYPYILTEKDTSGSVNYLANETFSQISSMLAKEKSFNR